jgi:glycosylphosphatidylinositol transamidase (GPIT) subunit GPI8
MDSSEEIVNELDVNELNYIIDLMNELNKTGKQHSISKIKRSDKVLDIETNYKISLIKK